MTASYVVVVTAIRLWHAVSRVEAEARRAGLDLESTYLVLPPSPTWWPAVLLGPPLAFVMWRLWRGARR
ncbi:MAG: hypothetical protein M3373_04980 [Gemmatimonadota bacterium]|nr:hypothetical protein [Gemmatimonadota bacterium]